MIGPDARPVTTDVAEAAEGRARPFLGKSLLDWLTGGVVLLVYVIVQVALLEGPRPFDSAKYFDTAVDFPHVPVDLWTMRIGLIAAVRAAVLVFGPSEAALYAVPVASGLVLAAAVYGTVLVLFGDRIVAAAASLVTVLNASWLFTSSFIYPDTTGTATFVAGMFFLVLAAAGWEDRGRAWVPTVSVVVAGVLFGWTYLIREYSPILVLAVAAALPLLRYPVRRIALLVGAALAAFALEPLYGLVRYHEPFLHARLLLERDKTSFPRPVGARMDYIQSQLDGVLDTALVFPRLVLAWRSGWVLLLLVPLFVVALVILRDRRLWLLAAWFFSFGAIMALLGLGSLSSGRWIINVTNIRYWSPIFPALVMGAFGGLALLLPRFVRYRAVGVAQIAAVLLAAAIIVPGVVEYTRCAERNAWPTDPAERWDGLRSWFSTPAADRYDAVWTDALTQRLVPAFTSTVFGQRLWDGDVRTFERSRNGLAPHTDWTRSLILVHKDRFRSVVPEPNQRLDELRGEWAPVFVSEDGRMVLLAHDSARAIGAVEGEQPWWSFAGRASTARFGTCGRNPYERGRFRAGA